MGHPSLVVAVAATIDIASYDTPNQILHSETEWLIVSRWGQDGEFVAISTTGLPAITTDHAPVGFAPQTTWLGLLMSERAATQESIFLIVRHLPRDMQVAGVFAPADGYARLCGEPPYLSLRAEGRQAHTLGLHHGREVRADIPYPAPKTAAASAWHIDAVRYPWVGEYVA